MCIIAAVSTLEQVAIMILQVRLLARSFSTAGQLIFRSATAQDVDTITRRAVQEGWHVGPCDYPCAVDFDPKCFYVGEVDGELATHFSIITYPNNHYHGGGLIVTEKFRRTSYALRTVYKAMSICSENYTIGADVLLDSKSNFEMLGFRKLWNTNIAMVNPEKIVANLCKESRIPPRVDVKPICRTNLDRLFKYDQTVFGTPRHILMTSWISIPGSLGWTAVDKESDNIVGYAIVKEVIRDAGTEIGLAMAPLYADNAQIAKLLLKTAAEYCLANEAVPKTKLELFHPVGDNCGEGAAELMDELEAELTPIAYRMYTKGIPPGRQMQRIYGISSPTID
jgi:hypothetical protein